MILNNTDYLSDTWLPSNATLVLLLSSLLKYGKKHTHKSFWLQYCDGVIFHDDGNMIQKAFNINLALYTLHEE